MYMKFLFKNRFLLFFCKTLRIFAETNEKSLDGNEKRKKNNAKRPTERSEWSILPCDNNDKQKEKKERKNDQPKKNVDAKETK